MIRVQSTLASPAPSVKGVGLALLLGLWALVHLCLSMPHRVVATPTPPAVWVSVIHLSLSFLLCLDWLYSIYFLFNSSQFPPWELDPILGAPAAEWNSATCSPATMPPPASQQALASGFHLLGGSLGVSRLSWTKHILHFNHSFGL